nr:MAG TPA: hypothetical protein [Caudoviricetes sp.]
MLLVKLNTDIQISYSTSIIKLNKFLLVHL